MTVAQLFPSCFDRLILILSRQRGPFEKVKAREMTQRHCLGDRDGEFIRFVGFGLILHLEQAAATGCM